MARKYVRIGSLQNIHIFDDGDFDGGVETDDTIKAGQVPVANEDVLRLQDFPGFPGAALTANRIVDTDAMADMASVTDLTDYIAGTANEVTVTDDGDGTVTISLPDDVVITTLKLLEKSSDPAEPSEGECIIWLSDGTGKGDDGDLMVASKAAGTTKYGTLFDHSGGAAW